MSDGVIRPPNVPKKNNDEETKRESPRSQAETLWEVYQLRTQWTLKHKVENLIVFWRFDDETIASILEVEVAAIADERTKLEKEWVELGNPPAENKPILRGQMIGRLTKLLRDLDRVSGEASSDPKTISTRLSIMTQLTKLQGLELDKKDAPEEAAAANTLEDKLNNLGPEKLAELHEALG